MPWQKTMVGLACVDILHSLLARNETENLILAIRSALARLGRRRPPRRQAVGGKTRPIPCAGYNYSIIDRRIDSSLSVLSRMDVPNGDDSGKRRPVCSPWCGP